MTDSGTEDGERGRLAQGDSMVIFGGCSHDEAYSDVWQLRVVSSQAHWVQLQITGVNRLYAASLCLLSTEDWRDIEL